MAELGDRVAAIAAKSAAKRAARVADAEVAKAVKVAEVEQKRAEFRAAMPVVAGVVDGFREVFGDGVRVLAARENGRSVVNATAMRRLCLDVLRYE